MTEVQVARAGNYDDVPIYALSDGTRVKIPTLSSAPNPALVNLYFDASRDPAVLVRWDGAAWVDVVASGGGPVSYDDLTDVPSTFPPSAHEHDHTILLNPGTRDASSAQDEYPYGVSSMEVSSEDDPAWPEGIGTVTTTRFVGDYDGSGVVDWSQQTFYNSYYRQTWIRIWNDIAWSSWSTSVSQSQGDSRWVLISSVSLGTDIIPASWNISDFPEGVSVQRISATNSVANEWPGGATDKTLFTAQSPYGRGSQTAIEYASGKTWVRSADYDADPPGWFDWREITVPDWDDITDKPSTFPPSAHEHDDRYYTETEVDDLLAGGEAVAWDDVTGKPSTFTPSLHAASHKGDGSDPIANATTSVSGLHSNTDKAKLDGIESGATVDQSAAEILTAIKTVDGSGSGLDADTLDGNNSTYFAPASDLVSKADLVSGVVPTSQLPALAINDVFTVASQAAMLALTAQRGDIAVRTDLDPDRTYMLSADDATVLANWIRVTFGDVVSVNGQTGVIVLGYADVGAAAASHTHDDRYFTETESDARFKAIGYVPAWVDITGKPSTFPPDAHNHDDRYYTEAESDARYLQSVPGSYATDTEVATAISNHEALSNPHPTYLTQAEADALYRAISYVPAWTEITGKPSTFAPSAHASSHTNGADDIQSASASQKGLMTTAYASKLDGIEVGATADMTAAEILTAVKTVDGTGSGLDADTLDGLDSGAFLQSIPASYATDAEVASAISAHEAASDPHPTYLTQTEGDARYSMGGGLTLTEVEASLGSSLRKSGKFSITSSGLTTGRHVLVTQANGPYTGKGTRADEAEMDHVNVTGKVTSATNIDCYWNSGTFVRGNFKFAYAVG